MYNNLLIITMALVEVGNVADKMGRAKGSARYMSIIDLADEAIMMSKVDMAKAKEELKLIKSDAGLKASFLADVKEKLDLVDDVLEEKIEEGLELGIKIFEDVKASIDFAKSFKKK